MTLYILFAKIRAEVGQPSIVATETRCSRFQRTANSWCECCSSHDEGTDPLKSAAWQKSVIWFLSFVSHHFWLFRIGDLDRLRSIWTETRINQQWALIWSDLVTEASYVLHRYCRCDNMLLMHTHLKLGFELDLSNTLGNAALLYNLVLARGEDDT